MDIVSGSEWVNYAFNVHGTSKCFLIRVQQPPDTVNTLLLFASGVALGDTYLVRNRAGRISCRVGDIVDMIQKLWIELTQLAHLDLNHQPHPVNRENASILAYTRMRSSKKKKSK